MERYSTMETFKVFIRQQKHNSLRNDIRRNPEGFKCSGNICLKTLSLLRRGKGEVVGCANQNINGLSFRSNKPASQYLSCFVFHFKLVN
jgi:hypothetical protein